MARLKRKTKRISLIIFLVIVLVGFWGVKSMLIKDDNNSIFNKEEEKEKENPIKTYKASLIATGDALLHSTVYNAGKTNGTYDFSNMLTYTKELIKDYDIKYYNQETIFDDSKAYSGYPRFNGPSQFGEDMLDTGFNLISLATNHSMDMGGDSAKKYASWWESQEGVLATGMASSSKARSNYKIMEANGITYTMLSYTYGTNGLGKSELANEPFIVNVWNEEQVLEDIAAVRDKVDILIVAMHWGSEYVQNATDTQRSQAKFLADNGVDIILGTHSHCIEPWEMIDDTVVFYSFGNFISNQMGAEEAWVRKVGVIGMFATLDITKVVDTENNTTTITIDNIGADLNYTYRSSSGAQREYLVIPFSKMEEKYLKNYESVYEEFSKVLKQYNENINIAPLPNTSTE